MAYRELIKNFNGIRSYMRSFYVYGFRHRNDYDEKSARGYDNERRRIESWLGEYMYFGQDAEGKRVFLSVDSRSIPGNPLYRAFRAKSFTGRDIMLHFYLLDILSGTDGLSVTEIIDELADALQEFDESEIPDESTVRKKLGEYCGLGLLRKEKRGRETVYSLSPDEVNLESWKDAVDYYSEAAPLGVIGSFLQVRLPESESRFRFKHHYILNALDSEIIFELAAAIGENRSVTLTMGKQTISVCPFKIYVSTQTGRQYLLAWAPWNERFSFFRIDQIASVNIGDRTEYTDALKEQLKSFQNHVWGVSMGDDQTLEHLEMTVFAGKDEGFIVDRLRREKRCGVLEQLDDRHWRFTADVFDALEMLPWVRTFTGRITDFTCSNPAVTGRFRDDLEAMSALYGGDADAVS